MSAKLEAAPGVTFWPGILAPSEQTALAAEVLAKAERVPFYRPTMPRTGAPFSVEMTNFGPLGWVSDQANGYRYQSRHPLTGALWPDMPELLLKLWDDLARYRAPPEACLINLYRAGAHMGLHQDMDEAAPDAPVLSVSLGDRAIFRFGGTKRGGRTRTLTLSSGDVVVFGGEARFMFHGVDRIKAGSSTLVPGGGRINLTLRRVSAPPDAAAQ
jgi:alkylated DNA repair protein (DNA oxidative demethylase)